MKPTVIYVDIDETLANWLGALFRLLDIDAAEVLTEWDSLGEQRPWDVAEVIGLVYPSLSGNEIWRRIDAAGASFWEHAHPYPWMHELLAVCETYAPVVLLTSPSKHPSSHAGKAQWIAKHFGRDFREYLIGSVKHRCAHPRAVLIDDSPKNCAKFREHEGRAILFPGVGNDLHHIPGHERVQYVADQLERLVS
jgi:5'(3')-deoxyribonucleotidase